MQDECVVLIQHSSSGTIIIEIYSHAEQTANPPELYSVCDCNAWDDNNNSNLGFARVSAWVDTRSAV